MLVRSTSYDSIVDILDRVFDRGVVIAPWTMAPGGIRLRSRHVRVVALVLEPRAAAGAKGLQAPEPLPESLGELHAWLHHQVALAPEVESTLLTAIDTVVTRQRDQWRESKDQAIQALCAGFADRIARMKRELSMKETTVNRISRYVEHVVGDLTQQTHLDPKTRLMHFPRFVQQLESFLAFEKRGRWCAVGLVDITGFKRYNDSLGHGVGDQIIGRVAQLLREQVRSEDLIARPRVRTQARDLHARLGGDEFCFLIPALDNDSEAYAIGERFRGAVAEYDWKLEDRRLAARPVTVDVGAVCVWLGAVAARRSRAGRLAADLMQRADTLMYQAKRERDHRLRFERARIHDGELV